jgi:hypothetical protein
VRIIEQKSKEPTHQHKILLRKHIHTFLGLWVWMDNSKHKSLPPRIDRMEDLDRSRPLLSHHHKALKVHKMYVQFFFITEYNPWGYQQPPNRVQLYKSTNSICKTELTSSTPTELRQQSSTDINLSQVRDLSVVQPACVRVLAHYNPRMYSTNL